MKPDGPIFILGLQRGGTNQLLNILRSHPDTTWPHGEFHEVLRPSWANRNSVYDFARIAYRYLPVLSAQGDLINPRKQIRPAALDQRTRKWISKGLAQATKKNGTEVSRYKAAIEAKGFFRNGPARSSRMVVKLVNYNVGLARNLHQIYPNAMFIGIMRDATGICESMMSRGAKPEKILGLYQSVAQTFLDLAGEDFPIMLLRFEEIITDIVATSSRVFSFCGLDSDAISGLCLQDKARVFDKNGKVVGMQKVDAYYDISIASTHLRGDVNASAHARLPEHLRLQIEASCGPLMQQLGYRSVGPVSD
ncbi:sulfotransferase [Ruegeria atlantica]|uniref:Sulfotransferase domain protein n=1 Tax=Ruegeria atlantica TaxID=81569 RepID=A0A0N7LNE8_9RHOB|nr:sulfotransferase [Ruegeria atlantica]CUH42220.1 Sulfotransferase domain protein [Ruegeria atlantica]